MSSQTLPPLPKEAFDGDKQKTEIHFVKCDHKDVVLTDTEVKCKCGAGWTGPNIVKLYSLLKNR